MRIFLDSSVLLSACGSKRSLSRLLTEISGEKNWQLVSAVYCKAETAKNLWKFDSSAKETWQDLEKKVQWVPNALTSRRPLLLTASKDKPVLLSALAAHCHSLLTLDKADFGILLGTKVYGMQVQTPRDFLKNQGLG